jgi:hypothetical protein
MSLYRVIQGNRLLVDGIFGQPFKALPLAKKPRHPVLFREALIHAIGEYETRETLGDETPFTEDEKLDYTVLRAHSRFASQKMAADHLVLKDILSSNKSGRTNVVEGAEVGAPKTPQGGRRYYSKLMVYMSQEPKYQGTPFKMQSRIFWKTMHYYGTGAGKGRNVDQTTSFVPISNIKRCHGTRLR